MVDPKIHASLEELRLSLLRLHKVLLDDEKVAYEAANGPVGNPARLLSLVMSDPWFDWLHKISRLIVRIDEVQEDKVQSPNGIEALVGGIFHEVQEMILPAHPDDEFMSHYKTCLRRSPAAVLAHAAVLKVVQQNPQKTN